jgi:hypothetical protein
LPVAIIVNIVAAHFACREQGALAICPQIVDTELHSTTAGAYRLRTTRPWRLIVTRAAFVYCAVAVVVNIIAADFRIRSYFSLAGSPSVVIAGFSTILARAYISRVSGASVASALVAFGAFRTANHLCKERFHAPHSSEHLQ